MEFGVRELVQFGTLLASLAGAFAVVKSQLSRVMQDIAQMYKILNEINTRIDQADADRAVIKHQNKVFSTILRTEMRVVHKNLDALAHMHNGRHPSVKGD